MSLDRRYDYMITDTTINLISQPFIGDIFIEDDGTERISEEVNRIIEKFSGKMEGYNRNIIAVGDIITDKLINDPRSKNRIRLCIVDGKTHGKPIQRRIKTHIFDRILIIKNKSGAIISKEVIGIIEDIFNDRPDKSILLKVIGEEDILIFPVLYFAPKGTLIFYGYRFKGGCGKDPAKKEGIIAVLVTDERKKELENIIKTLAIIG